MAPSGPSPNPDKAPKSGSEPPPAAEEGAERALRRILRGQWEEMARHRQGALSDTDPEPLHDFRVALRRARSLLKEMGDVFPPKSTRELADELEWLGSATGASRDLDVMLASLEPRAEEQPEPVRDDLKPLFEVLSDRRREARKELAEALGSERCDRLLATLDTFSARRPTLRRAPPAALRPLGELASERIWEAAGRVVKRGQKAGESDSAKDLHRLRIACKRLRYLLEFFRTLYPPRQIAALLRSLKGLQDLLGKGNDLAVQEKELRKIAGELAGDRDQVATLLALGVLLAQLVEERQELLEQIRPALRAFLGRRNQARLRRLTRAEESR